MQDAPKAVWSISYISVAFFPSLKQHFIAYCSSKVSDCIFEIHQLWQSGFSRVYSNCCCSCSFETEIIKIGPSSHKMYSNNILNVQESTTILNACTKKVWKFIVCTSYKHTPTARNTHILFNKQAVCKKGIKIEKGLLDDDDDDDDDDDYNEMKHVSLLFYGLSRRQFLYCSKTWDKRCLGMVLGHSCDWYLVDIHIFKLFIVFPLYKHNCKYQNEQ